MVRSRDMKGIYISIDKTPKDIFRPRRVPKINYVDGYTCNSSRRGREATSQPKIEISKTMDQQGKNLKEETKQDIRFVIDQEADPKPIHQFFNQTTDLVLCQVKLGMVVDSFGQNLVEEPSESDRDTTPTTSSINFFGGMADHEAHRRAFGGDEEEGQRQEILEKIKQR